MYIYKKLYVTSGLYLVFLALAIMGYVEWKRSYTRRTSPASS
jgi:nicotinamide mononucleotide transporter